MYLRQVKSHFLLFVGDVHATNLPPLLTFVRVFFPWGGGVEHATSAGEVHKQGCMETGDRIMIAANTFQMKNRVNFNVSKTSLVENAKNNKSKFLG